MFHIGNVRTALFNFLFSKKNGGKFVLRIEDTDTDRYKPEYEKDIIETLAWLGLHWDEGPFKQSARSALYAGYLKQLLENGDAFYCFHSKEFLEREREKQIQNKEIPAHNCEFKKVPLRNSEKRVLKESAIVRFRMPVDLEVSFMDLIRGKINFNSGALGGDFSLAKTEGPGKFLPLYNFAVVIDDFEMKISHVIRGEDHISNTPKQILIQEALELKSSQFAHLPLILGPDKSKMSKRHGAISVGEYQKQGYLSEALVNFMVLLGWNPGTEKEIFNLEELIKEFSLERVHKGGAIFNLQRLDWINGQYIKNMDTNELTEKCLPYLPKGTELKFAKKVVALEKERIKKLSEIGELTKFFFNDELEYDPELLIWKKMSLKEVKNNLEILEKKLSKTEDFDQKSLEDLMIPLREKYGTGELLWPLRVALSGQSNSPGPFEIMEILGKEKTLKRIKKAIKKVSL